ncbi:hypothetical protein LTR37_021237 [Vermiconidia calcicola]|uniref:Uncharacterized protein n=1 Tax=Vermiconidia calcicola TaxID=1690605 RepID=A0ACC3M9F2_9PEZI|nr:hypothetical protein LTR37_021237 [Vermiconidia calcicola]
MRDHAEILLEAPVRDHGDAYFETLDEDTGDVGRESNAHARTRRLLYISHFLSTWNSRTFEFAAFLFLATIYPQTLLPASVYALARASAAALFSPCLGSYIDHAERLTLVRCSIIGQRVAVAVSCTLLLAILELDGAKSSHLISYSALVLLSLLACVEKLSAVLNTIAVERDWVVVVAQDDQDLLRTMNSQMRRIDLFCKLIGPLLISFIDSASSRPAIVVTCGMTVTSVLAEYFAIARVYEAVPGLRERKGTARDQRTSLFHHFGSPIASTLVYLRHPVFLPSFSLALLYLTVLSFNGQMITYLLAFGIPSRIIGVLRGISAIFELSATWITPRIMQRTGPVRSGIWFINYQITCVGVACLFFWLPSTSAEMKLYALPATTAVIASRIGLWGFDLSAQTIVQEEVEAELRGTFSSQEASFQNIFEMLSFASTIVFARPENFKIPASVSAGAVAFAAVLYAVFVRARRGHLVHLSRCMERHWKFDRAARARGGWRLVSQQEYVAQDTEVT